MAANPMSSMNLSILSFALSSWLDGSAQLRRSLILFPLELGGVHHDTESYADVEPERARFADRCMRWLKRSAKDMDEAEKAVLGVLDVSSSVLLLRLLGSGPIFPFILNPLSIALALPRKLSIGPVEWSQVILMCILLSTLHEAQRTSVAAGLAWLRLKRAASKDASVGEVVLMGQKLAARSPEDAAADEDEEECVICSGVGYDVPLSDSISGATSLSQPGSSAPALGPLEAFCVHAPAKHPMHRACFAAWTDAYWDARAAHSRPVIALASDDGVVPNPGTMQWGRAQAMLGALGARIAQNACFVPVAPAQLPAVRREGSVLGESVFTLRDAQRREATASDAEMGAVLGSMVSAWPPCPGCRSAVKMIFVRALSRRHSAEDGKGMFSRMLCVWIRSWKRLVSGRTIVVKTTTQVLFAVFLVSMTRIRKSHSGHLLITRHVM